MELKGLEFKYCDIEKIGSSVSRLGLPKRLRTLGQLSVPKIGDVVAVKALSESSTYGNLELPTGRLAKINSGDILVGTFGKRRALKGFVGDMPETVQAGDRLHLLNMGGVIGKCTGHHSALSDAIEVEVLGLACDPNGAIINLSDNSLPPANELLPSAPIIVVAGSCMNSGKTVAAVEIIKQASNRGVRVVGAKLSGIACLRDTLHMEDHGAIATASFLDCGLPSTVDHDELPSIAKAIINQLNTYEPDLIVAELGDGIVGGYSVDSVLMDTELRAAISSFVFCASDYVGVIGGESVLDRLGIGIDVVAGSVTDSQMGEEYVAKHFGLAAGNAKRDPSKLFDLIYEKVYSGRIAFQPSRFNDTPEVAA